RGMGRNKNSVSAKGDKKQNQILLTALLFLIFSGAWIGVANLVNYNKAVEFGSTTLAIKHTPAQIPKEIDTTIDLNLKKVDHLQQYRRLKTSAENNFTGPSIPRLQLEEQNFIPEPEHDFSMETRPEEAIHDIY